MPSSPLTDRRVQTAVGPTEIWDGKLPGFGLRIGSPNARWTKGKKTWQVMYRVHGPKKQRLKIGSYPTTGLAEAREEARAKLSLAEKGIDPKTIAAEQADRHEYTVERLAAEYIEKDAKRRNRRWRDKEQQIRRHILPRWSRRPASSITTRDVIELNDEMQAQWKGAPTSPHKQGQFGYAAGGFFDRRYRSLSGSIGFARSCAAPAGSRF